jgi:VanZ family protein
MIISKKEILYWSLFSLYCLFILATLPYIVTFQRAMGQSLKDSLYAFIVLWIAKPSIIFFAYIFLDKQERRLSRYIGIIISILLIIGAVYYLILGTNYPASSKAVEFIHFFEYGLLCFLVFIALKERIHNPLVYIWGLLLVSIFGFIDEGIQWIIPSRTGEFKDALTNIACAITFQLFISQVIELPRGLRSINKQEIKVLLRGVSAFFVAMTIFVFLVNSGFVIFDKQIGYFNSRFVKEDLLSMKKQRENSDEGIEIIKTKPQPIVIKPQKWGVTDLYEQEAKSHIRFRNDLLKWSGYRDAYAENKILEKYYDPMMKRLNQSWSKVQKKDIFKKIPDKKERYYYHSKMIDNILTGSTKIIILILLMTFSIFPLVLDLLTDG